MANSSTPNIHILRPGGNNIEDGSITDADISPTAGIKASKIDFSGVTVVTSISVDSTLTASAKSGDVTLGIDQSQRDYRNWWESW